MNLTSFEMILASRICEIKKPARLVVSKVGLKLSMHSLQQSLQCFTYLFNVLLINTKLLQKCDHKEEQIVRYSIQKSNQVVGQLLLDHLCTIKGPANRGMYMVRLLSWGKVSRMAARAGPPSLNLRVHHPPTYLLLDICITG